ncbi:MAG: alcohol dehydrogenase catalytic domain-containing protein, partial [Candidatus Caldatribacteriaceae bacterium]
MKAAVMEDIGKIVVKDVPRPKIKAGELLLSVKACAVCGSDVRTIWHGSSHVKPPRILGHEVVGTILEVGEGILGYEVGDLVAVAPAIGCGKCMYCRSGHTNMCPELETIGFEFDGGFAEIMVVPAKGVLQGYVNKLPAGLLPEQAVISEPLACCLNGQELLGISLGQRVAVIGAGIIGLFHTELALLKGASQVFVVDVVAKRLEYARALGERVVVINSVDTNPVTEILSQTDGYG